MSVRSHDGWLVSAPLQMKIDEKALQTSKLLKIVEAKGPRNPTRARGAHRATVQPQNIQHEAHTYLSPKT